MPLRMGLQMDDRVDPFAPAFKAFAHPEGSLARMLFNVRSARSNEVAKVFVLEGKRLQGAEQNSSERIIALRKAIEALQQPMQFFLVRIAEDSKETSLGMALLHWRPLGTVALTVSGSGVHQELTQPCVNQHGIQGETVVIPVKEKLGFRRVRAVFGAHEIDHLMVGRLMTNTEPPQ